MTPTYPIREVLNLIYGATAVEMMNLVKLLEEDVTQYTMAEHTVLLDHIKQRRQELESIKASGWK